MAAPDAVGRDDDVNEGDANEDEDDGDNPGAESGAASCLTDDGGPPPSLPPLDISCLQK